MAGPTPPAARDAPGARRRLAIPGALLLYATLAVLLTAEAWGSPSTRWAGGCCDQQQMMWFLRWIPSAIERGLDPFVTSQMNAPTGVNLTWNSWTPAIGLALAPVTVVAGPIVAYNVAIVGAIALSALAAFVALRRYADGLAGPLVGGAVYGFSPYVTSHASLHLNLVAVWVPPLVLIVLDELLARRRRGPVRLGAALGVLAGLQVLIFEELVATGAVAAAVLAAILALTARNRATIAEGARRVGRAALPALAGLLVVAGLPLAVQFLGPLRIGGQVQDTARFSTDLLNVVLPTRYQLFAPEAATSISYEFSGLYHEATAYLGLPLLVILVVVAARRWADRRLRVAGLMAAAMLVLSLGQTLRVGGAATGVPLPWLPLSLLPLLEHAIPGRLTLYLWLAVAAIVAVLVGELAARHPSQAAPRLAALGLALAVALPAPLGSSTVEVPAFFRSFDRQGIGDDAIVLVAPHFTNGAGAAPMLWAAVAGNRPRLYEAYAYVPDDNGQPRYGPAPTQLTRIMERIQDDGVTLVARGAVREQVLRDIAATGITDVIVGPMDHREQMVVFFTDLFGRPPAEVDGVQLWHGVAGG
ncbi:MAG: hypothetical protein A2V85_13725 [Chloroflexi bacterium RBG_16_72_14]|nr:MAG: hypothetical protein A2V85_13725 [Chloroflexi bacterium RBG_16_72_14]